MKLFEFKNFNKSFNIEIKRFKDHIELKIVHISNTIKNQILKTPTIGDWRINVGVLPSDLNLSDKVLFLNDEEFSKIEDSKITFIIKGNLTEIMNELIEFSTNLEKIQTNKYERIN